MGATHAGYGDSGLDRTRNQSHAAVLRHKQGGRQRTPDRGFATSHSTGRACAGSFLALAALPNRGVWGAEGPRSKLSNGAIYLLP